MFASGGSKSVPKESVNTNQMSSKMNQMSLKASPIPQQNQVVYTYEMRQEGRQSSITARSFSDAPSDEQRETAEDGSLSLDNIITVPRDPSSSSVRSKDRKKNKFGVALSLGIKKSVSNLNLKKSMSSTSSSSSVSITRKQVNGNSKQGKFIKTSSTPQAAINVGDEWKSPGERANKSKHKSFAFKGSQASSYQDNLRQTTSLRSASYGHRALTPENLSRVDGTASLYASKASSAPTAPDLADNASVTKSIKNRPGTPPPRHGLSYDFAREPDVDSNTPPPSPMARSFPTVSSKKAGDGDSQPKPNPSVDGSVAFQANGMSPLAIVCTSALDVVGGIGNVVQVCMQKIESLGEKSNIGQFIVQPEENGYSVQPMNTFEEELMDEIDRLDRMNSWDTHGTFTTVNTLGTAATGVTLATVETLATKDNEGLLISENDLQLQGGNPTTIRITSNTKKPKKKKKRVKRRKTVNFQYPPISSMKECPRITEDERKLLFFTEEELDEYENDRRDNLCDDVEVVAVEYTDSESDSSDDDDDDADVPNSALAGSSLLQAKQTTPNPNSSLRVGKYSAGSSDNKSIANTTVTDSLASTTETRALSKASAHSSGNKNRSSKNAGKIKGVQIYLRQRSMKQSKSRR